MSSKLVGPRYTATTWQEQNRQLLDALNMERIVTIIIIGLIELVAALNILITLVMMVMEKYRDIAVLMSMGARQAADPPHLHAAGRADRRGGQRHRPGRWATRSAISPNKYRLDPLDESVYSLSFVPFEPHWVRRHLDRRRGHTGELPGDALPRPQRHPHRAGRSAAVRISGAGALAKRHLVFPNPSILQELCSTRQMGLWGSQSWLQPAFSRPLERCPFLAQQVAYFTYSDVGRVVNPRPIGNRPSE